MGRTGQGRPTLIWIVSKLNKSVGMSQINTTITHTHESTERKEHEHQRNNSKSELLRV